MIVFILNILFACTHLCAGEYKNPTLEIINSIPQQDREEIKSLFKNLFKIHTFAYSLYGDKPMTYGDVCLEGNSLFWTYEICQLDQLYKEILEIYSEPCVLTKKRWEIWKKYNNRFRMKKYLLMEKSIGKRKRIFLINKEAFRKIIDNEIDIFKRIIGKEISSEKLLSEFQSENTNVLDLLNDSEGLLGILLGFGKHNSMLFQKREDILDDLEWKKNSHIYRLEELKNKLNLANNKLQSLHEHDPYIIASINRVCFVADTEHDETVKLRKKYDNLNRKINEIYSREDWFEQTLIQLTSD